MKIVIGISGASGSIYGVSLLKELKKNNELHLIITEAARVVIKHETSYTIDEIEALADFVYKQTDIAAPIASGSFLFDAMVIIPCSIKSLSLIANCYAENVLARAADVALKERRKLVLCIREMPLHEGHLNLMLSATRMGAIICPLSPSFYHKPATIEELITHVTGKVVDLIGAQNSNYKRWTGAEIRQGDVMNAGY
jgi:4-hydroxy-3-polyprenylbenzoate decarboxylase